MIGATVRQADEGRAVTNLKRCGINSLYVTENKRFKYRS
jgi:hypothetical protein